MPYSLELAPGLVLTEFRPADAAALVQHLNHRTIYDWTLRIPHPYTLASAEEYLAIATQQDAESPLEHLAIRRAGELVGGCGLQRLAGPFAAHRAELGYWVAPACWGQGIATRAVAAVCRAAPTLGLEKLTAFVFEGNQASTRVLEKNGFRLEGRHPRHYRKDGKLIDVLCFGLCESLRTNR